MDKCRAIADHSVS